MREHASAHLIYISYFMLEKIMRQSKQRGRASAVQNGVKSDAAIRESVANGIERVSDRHPASQSFGHKGRRLSTA